MRSMPFTARRGDVTWAKTLCCPQANTRCYSLDWVMGVPILSVCFSVCFSACFSICFSICFSVCFLSISVLFLYSILSHPSTTIIKLETAGCPPFWSDGFRSFRNAMEFGKHTKQYVECSMTDQKSALYRRDEHYSHEVLSLFATSLDVLYPMTQLRVMSEHDSMDGLHCFSLAVIENGKGIHHAIMENSFDRVSQFLQYHGSEYYVNFVNEHGALASCSI